MTIPEKRVQCKFCGRIRMNGTWRTDQAIADVVGICPLCLDYRHRAHIRQEKAWQRRLHHRRAKPCRDPFAHVRYDAEKT